MHSYWEKCVNNMMEHILADSSLKAYVMEGPPENKGFMWEQNENINKLAVLTESDGHSGASFACCMRACQERLIEKFKINLKLGKTSR